MSRLLLTLILAAAIDCAALAALGQSTSIQPGGAVRSDVWPISNRSVADLADGALQQARHLWFQEAFPGVSVPPKLDQTHSFDDDGRTWLVTFQAGIPPAACAWYDKSQGICYTENKKSIWAVVTATVAKIDRDKDTVVIPLEDCELSFFEAVPGYRWIYGSPKQIDSEFLNPRVTDANGNEKSPDEMLATHNKASLAEFQGLVCVGASSQEGFGSKLEDDRANARALALATAIRRGLKKDDLSNFYTLALGTHRKDQTTGSGDPDHQASSHQRPLMVIGIRVYPRHKSRDVLTDNASLRRSLLQGFDHLKAHSSALRQKLKAQGILAEDYSQGDAFNLSRFPP